ncbi:hypothetical protein B0181_02010 [Moraxella caviae]|uniref:Uncharacterized protein n=1 Tax=Moraxella caviae TaxID=34060 RepID=A0A1T0A8X4_9GAMM|nr:hypothetical protein B0181_02010 [Moraxella caviae]
MSFNRLVFGFCFKMIDALVHFITYFWRIYGAFVVKFLGLNRSLIYHQLHQLDDDLADLTFTFNE